MARPLRFDEPGTLHHVTNRGNSKRPTFESRTDIHYFLSLVARSVHAGRILVICYSVLTTHFHLFLESLDGELSRTLQWIESTYAGRFNRSRDRKGHLYGGRFWSRRVRTRRYFWALPWYFDRNAVEARIVASAEDYPYCSAWHYARESGPPWLDRSRLEQGLVEMAGADVYTPELYLEALSRHRGRGRYEVMDRIARSSTLQLPDDFDDLVGAAPPFVQAWLAENAKTADGCGSHVIVAAPGTLRGVIHGLQSASSTPAAPATGGRADAWVLLEAGLLHGACGLPLRRIATLQGVSVSSIHRRVQRHRAALSASEDYLHLSAEVLRQAITIDFGDVPCPGATVAGAPLAVRRCASS